MIRKPQGQIEVNATSNIARGDGKQVLQVINPESFACCQMSDRLLHTLESEADCASSPVACCVVVQIVTGKRVYYLKADSPNLLDEWLRVLHSVLRVKAASPLFTHPDMRPSMKGLLIKVRQRRRRGHYTDLQRKDYGSHSVCKGFLLYLLMMVCC